jgi:hypothetical protein
MIDPDYPINPIDLERHTEPGISMREHFAVMAMQGMLSGGFNPSDTRALARRAALIADDLLESRD